MVRIVSAVIAFAAVGLSVSAMAMDGVIELSQTCATQTGCTPTDSAGFPLTLTARGSYRLTSNLQIPFNTNGIEISSADITIDFNGFTLFGPATVSAPPELICSGPGGGGGSGLGISATGAASGFVAMNGRVRGMGDGGISLPSAQTVRIERMTLEENCGHGIELGTAAIVDHVQVRANTQTGIVLSFGGIVRDSVVEWNRASGIVAVTNSVLANNVTGSNGFAGIVLRSGGPPGGLVIGNSAQGNGWNGGSPNPGIIVESGASALLNNASGNTGSGISAAGTAGLGLNTVNGNGGVEITGGVTIGCNSTDTTKVCP